MLAAIIPPSVTGQLLHTSGDEQVVVPTCPGCGHGHRHLALGLRTAPCKAVYIVTLAPKLQPIAA